MPVVASDEIAYQSCRDQGWQCCQDEDHRGSELYQRPAERNQLVCDPGQRSGKIPLQPVDGGSDLFGDLRACIAHELLHPP
jgi:hypothetical protein